MKSIFIFSIIMLFGIIGYMIKLKYKRQYILLKMIEDYVGFYDSNISLFKENLIKINNNYKIMHKNKNANYYNLFLKNNTNSVFDLKILQNYIINTECVDTINLFLTSIGLSEYEYEKEKVFAFKNYINNEVFKANEDVKSKGDLWFKIVVMVGVVFAIIIW